MAVNTNSQVVSTQNTTYERTSPYFQTTNFGKYLDIATLPAIPAQPDDVLFAINLTYRYRPDLLAYDLYGDANLWWVFALRNPNTIQDPVFDMVPGKRIFLPKKDTLSGVLGI
jgi:hypothetical protein